MKNLSRNFLPTLCLLAIGLFLYSCSEQGIQLEKQSIQFSLNADESSDDVGAIVLPDNARARITVASSNGVAVLSDHEVGVIKTDAGYFTETVDLIPGAYVVTDFVIEHDSLALYVAPKKGAELASDLSQALPYNFSIQENNPLSITMRLMNVTDQELERFGYASGKKKQNNTIAITVVDKNISVTKATAELRQNNKLIRKFSLTSKINTISLGGDSKSPYTLTVYTANSAKTQTFDLKKLKQQIGKNPYKITLEPALVLTIDSYVDEGNEYEEYFNFRMDGKGTVRINWGDGFQNTSTLPLEIEHEYTTGQYTAFITGDIQKATDFSGFSYGSIITTITGLRNLTSLKVYDPSWGAVPIKVDLSNCKKLETVNVAKYGAPYEPCDLRTEFKLPLQSRLTTFIFDAPSFDSGREYISAEELEVMVTTVYNNAIARQISNGKFFVNPVVTPNAATQRKLDILQNQYNWRVGFNDEIYSAYDDISGGRMKITSDPNSLRDEWIRARFSNSDQIISRGSVVASK